MLAVGCPLTGESPRADVSSVAHGFTVHGFGQHHTLAPGAQLLKMTLSLSLGVDTAHGTADFHPETGSVNTPMY